MTALALGLVCGEAPHILATQLLIIVSATAHIALQSRFEFPSDILQLANLQVMKIAHSSLKNNFVRLTY